jgi:hypothetical protein
MTGSLPRRYGGQLTGSRLGSPRFLFPFLANPIADTFDSAFAAPEEWGEREHLARSFRHPAEMSLLTTPAGMPANATWKVALPFVICKRVRQDFSAECNNRDE